MIRNNQKNKHSFLNRLLRSKLAIVFEIVILIALSTALAKEIIHKYQISSEINGLQEEVAKLEQNNLELNDLISYFESDTYKEEQARLQLGLQKPDEKVIAVLGDSTELAQAEADQAVAVAANTNDTRDNPQKWWDYYFNMSN
ncbi:septum formation initiator family protein [Patescibacteria group bacterium]|nr:septum formation initiator family protein [Patescibacteria group bacterium]MBU0964159.1 septum formation initiator family protein [Patescibacteria group bacterium]